MIENSSKCSFCPPKLLLCMQNDCVNQFYRLWHTRIFKNDFYTPFQLDEHDFSKHDMMDSRLESRNYYDHIVIFSWTLDSKSGLMTSDLQHTRLITLMCYDKNLHTTTQQKVYEKVWRYSCRLNYCYFVVCASIKP